MTEEKRKTDPFRRKGRRRLLAVRDTALEACTDIEHILAGGSPQGFSETVARLQRAIAELQQKPRIYKRLPCRGVTPPE